MAKQFVSCQLPGCTRVIAVSPEEPTPRKYCCPDHRVAARRLRHEVLAENEAPAPAPVRPILTAVIAKPIPRPQPRSTARADRPITGERVRQGVELGRQGAKRGVELGRVATTEVRTRYQHGQQQIARGLLKLRTSWREATQRQRRAAILIGFLAVMLIGSGWIAVLATGDEAASKEASTPPMSSVTTPQGMAAWAKQASVDLMAVQNQLGEVAKGESAWNALPATARTGALANNYTALEQRKSLLQQEQTMLQAGLSAVANVRQTGKTLDGVEGQLNNLSTTVAAMPPAEQRNDARTTVRGQLLAQQAVLQQECATLHEELSGWLTSVQVALTSGLPDSTDNTVGMVNLIVAASQQTPPPAPAPVPAPTVILADGPTSRSRQDVNTSAPPHHHKSSSGSAQSGARAISVAGVADLGGLEQIG
ncbi:MAG TPA: hypothetical protein VHZ97_05760, partial [Pseudonocardiaceae bacterium]|nr:hypothetical protein [Pseudonocardiaceae bacterium]